MYKFVTCNCKRYRLDQLEINYTYSFSFEECHCQTDHKIFVVRCKIHPYNLVGFARNYFASIFAAALNRKRTMSAIIA